MAFSWERWNALPLGGGLLDQPAGLLERMRTAKVVWEIWRTYRKRPPGWECMTPSAWNVVLAVALALYTGGVADDPGVRKLARVEFVRRLGEVQT